MKKSFYLLSRSTLFILSMILSGSLFGKQPRPNIIFIMLDDLGYSQIEAYARGLSISDCDPKFVEYVESIENYYEPEDAMRMVKRSTPTISRLADEGFVFRNAFACSNLCAPARIGVATGIHQNRWGIYRNIDTESHGLRPNSHLAEQFKDLGYATAHIGKWHVGSKDTSIIETHLKARGLEIENPLDWYWTNQTHLDVRQEVKDLGYEGSCIPKDHALNNGFDYYFGYNQWESPFYGATNIWEGFQHVGEIKEYNTDVFTDKALHFIKESLDAETSFYVQLHYHAVHGPLMPIAPEKYQRPFDSPSELLNNFYAHIYAVDYNIQRILDYLETRDEAKNTLIVFTSDNGGANNHHSTLPGNAPYIGHKGSLNLGGLKVPMIFSWPEKLKPQQSDELVVTYDILPTLLDAAGGNVPEGLDGKSLLPLMTQENMSPLRDFFVMGGIHARAWGFMISTSLYGHNQSRELAPSGYVVVSKDMVLRFTDAVVPNHYKDALDGIPAHYGLYNHTDDPGEKVNLVSTNPEMFQKLQSVWVEESKEFPKPVVWRADRWEAMMRGDTN